MATRLCMRRVPPNSPPQSTSYCRGGPQWTRVRMMGRPPSTGAAPTGVSILRSCSWSATPASTRKTTMGGPLSTWRVSTITSPWPASCCRVVRGFTCRPAMAGPLSTPPGAAVCYFFLSPILTIFPSHTLPSTSDIASLVSSRSPPQCTTMIFIPLMLTLILILILMCFVCWGGGPRGSLL